jgi:hypothetical protein
MRLTISLAHVQIVRILGHVSFGLTQSAVVRPEVSS